MTDTPTPTRILFVGNSYTSRHQLPRLIADLAANATPPIDVAAVAIVAGGASLRRHWNAGVAQKTLARSRWDHLVLQEQSTLPVKNPVRYHENVRLFAAEAAQRATSVALYLTWSRQSAPQTQAQITDAVQRIAEEIGARVVPVGAAWHRAMAERPDLALYLDDGSHPTALGAYLTACVFAVALLDRRLTGFAVSDPLQIDRSTAHALHQIAEGFARGSSKSR